MFVGGESTLILPLPADFLGLLCLAGLIRRGVLTSSSSLLTFVPTFILSSPESVSVPLPWRVGGVGGVFLPVPFSVPMSAGPFLSESSMLTLLSFSPLFSTDISDDSDVEKDIDHDGSTSFTSPGCCGLCV